MVYSTNFFFNLFLIFFTLFVSYFTAHMSLIIWYVRKLSIYTLLHRTHILSILWMIQLQSMLELENTKNNSTEISAGCTSVHEIWFFDLVRMCEPSPFVLSSVVLKKYVLTDLQYSCNLNFKKISDGIFVYRILLGTTSFQTFWQRTYPSARYTNFHC